MPRRQKEGIYENRQYAGLTMIRCIVAGGRGFDDWPLLKRKLDAIFARQEVVEIVSGGAPGADTLGERYAAERGWPVARFPADWDDISVPGASARTRRDGTQYNANAGPMRNAEMVAYATHLVAFPGGRGTADCVRQAREAGLVVRVVTGRTL